MDYLVDRWLARAGASLLPGNKAHAFHHTHVLEQLDYRTSIAELQQLLGYADTSTTHIYPRRASVNLHESARAAPTTQLVRQR